MTALDDYLENLGVGLTGLYASDLALADGAAVSSWTDRYGGVNAVQATGSMQPTFRNPSLFGAVPAVRFDGGDILTMNALATSLFGGLHNDWTVIAAFAPSDIGAVNRNLIGVGRSSSAQPFTTLTLNAGMMRMNRRGDANESVSAFTASVAEADDTPNILTYRHARRELSAWAKGLTRINQQPRVVSTQTQDRLAIGGLITTSTTASLMGDLATLIILSAGVSDDVLNDIEALLGAELGVGVTPRSLHSDALILDAAGAPANEPNYSIKNEKVYVGAIRADGMVCIAEVGDGGDRISVWPSSVDDHNSAAILAPAGKTPIVLWVDHAGSSQLEWRRGSIVDDLTDGWEDRQARTSSTSEGVDYAIAHHEGGDNAIVFTRVGNKAWHFWRTTNWFASMGASTPLFDFGVGNQGYLKTNQVGNVLRVFGYGHPTLSTIPDIFYFEIDLPTGNVRKRDGTVLGNLNGTNLPLTPATAEVVYSPSGTRQATVLDVSDDAGTIAAILLEKNENGITGAEYRHLRWTGSAWSSNVICPAGVGFLYSTTNSFGGASFMPGNAEEIYLSRNDVEAVWTFHKGVTSNGGDTWVLTTVATSPGLGEFWIRPIALPEAETFDFVFKEITDWNEAAIRPYQDYEGNTRALIVDPAGPRFRILTESGWEDRSYAVEGR